MNKFFSSKLAAFYIQYITRILNGVAILTLLPIFLTTEEIGLWFSIFALGFAANIVDAGFTNIVLINVAKEKVDISGNLTQFLGYINFIKRKIVFIYAPILFFITTIIFTSITLDNGYFIIWIVYFIGTILMLLNAINLSILEGMGFILTATWIRTVIPIVNLFVVFYCLITGLGLWALSCSIVFQWLASKLLLSMMLNRYGVIINMPSTSDFHRQAELKSLMKRYTISWVSGYLQNHGIIPLLALTNGLALSGQVGMLYNLLRLSFGFSNVLVRKNLQEYSINMVQHGYYLSKKIFTKDAIISIMVFCLFVGTVNISIFLSGYVGLEKLNGYAKSLPDLTLTLLISLLWILIGISGTFSIFFRTAGKELYAVLGLTINILNLLIIYSQNLINTTIYEVYTMMCIFLMFYALLFIAKITERK